VRLICPRAAGTGLARHRRWPDGAGLTRLLVDEDEWVVEIDRPKRAVAATAPRATPWTPAGPAAKPWPADHLTSPRQGKSQREIRRCLKRTVARQLYRLLERTATNQAGS
jgi:hypothetical protein